ncbi:MAG: 2-isopropylmalate synthase [Opitutia bacterium TMED67]|nr:2-isopropylmalate synthase [Verrucomicrobiales bacterium]OUU77715.1 MAG: 2-isopropylmalate synthase [Opitutae bacterium TMED67]|tara:strand:- start:2130 stop:3719 length:1590 start_codon:yes stop_codon:yes gene_type:complete
MKKNRIIIFDTTLRDGEQCPGASMTLREKLEVARQLARLKVDVIEGGFPVISDGDFTAVNTIAKEIKGPIIAGLARCVPKDIEAAGKAVAPAGIKGRIHVFLATSKLHREFKLGKAQSQIIKLAVEGVKRARKLTADVEFSPEDGSRTEPDFLAEVCQAVVDAGATTVNIPDTVGWAVPGQFGELIGHLHSSVPEFKTGKAVISVHCHNDLGMAVANSLAAVENGARQIECTVNGIGERAGNAALEELVMALKTREDYYKNLKCGIKTKELVKSSRLVSRMSSFVVQRNKSIVGENAFAHSSGIHQDGIIKKRETYEIMDPQDVGWGQTELPLTKHSGRAAMALRLKHLGFKLTDDEIINVFSRFKEIGDKKKFVYDDDLGALVDGQMTKVPETWLMEYVNVTSGNQTVPTATVRLRKPASGRSKKDTILEDAGVGDGPVDAALKAIDRLTETQGILKDYALRGVSQGKDALGEVSLKVDFGDGELITGKGASTDVIEASAKAYLNAVNRHLSNKRRKKTTKKKTKGRS